MKQINTYINEKLRLSAKRQYTCQPKDKDELREIIVLRIDSDGNECDLNDIDTSKITDMSNLFNTDDDYDGNKIFEQFNGDISMWNVSNVTNMGFMFYGCKKFNCDLSKWNVSKVDNMYCMFYGCTDFNGDISTWNVSNVINMEFMFEMCTNFNCDISQWNMSNVKDIGSMFYYCKKFKQDLDSWDVSNVGNYMYNAFKNCPSAPKWYDRKKYD
jgi:surface protein